MANIKFVSLSSTLFHQLNGGGHIHARPSISSSHDYSRMLYHAAVTREAHDYSRMLYHAAVNMEAHDYSRML